MRLTEVDFDALGFDAAERAVATWKDAVAAARDAVWAEQLDWLAEEAAGWGAVHAARAVAAPRWREGRFPRIRLLLVPQWSRALGDGHYVFLQALRDALFVRVVGPHPPSAVALAVAPPGARALRPLAGVLLDQARVFALPALNGRGGRLWRVPDRCSADLILGARPATLTLEVEHGEQHRRLEPVTLPGTTAQDAARRSARRLRALVRAYHSGDAAAFARALDTIVHNRQGDGPVAYPGRSWLRSLSRWEALLVRAHLAEVRARARDADRWGLPLAALHPQLALE